MVCTGIGEMCVWSQIIRSSKSFIDRNSSLTLASFFTIYGRGDGMRDGK